MNYYIRGNKDRGREVIELLESKGGSNPNRMDGRAENGYYYIDKNNIIDISVTHKDMIEKLCEELTLPEKWIHKFKIGDEVDFFLATPGIVCDINYDSKIYTIKQKQGKLTFTSNEESMSLHKWDPKFKSGDFVKSSDSPEPGTIISINYVMGQYKYFIHIYNNYFWAFEDTLTLYTPNKFSKGDYAIYNDDYHSNIPVQILNNDDKRYHIKAQTDGKFMLEMTNASEDSLEKWTPKRGDHVLVRDFPESRWDEGIFSYYDSDENKFKLQGGVMYDYCAPFNIDKLGKVTEN